MPGILPAAPVGQFEQLAGYHLGGEGKGTLYGGFPPERPQEVAQGALPGEFQSGAQQTGSDITVSADDPMFVWPIPQHELLAPGSEIEPNESNR